MAMTNKHNPADATTRNVRASKKRDAALDARVDKLETAVKMLAHALHFSNGVKFDQGEFFRALDAE